MKKLIMLVIFMLVAGTAYADVYVNGYTRKDGTYVQPYYRSNPNHCKQDNYSYKNNYNPYTGKKGTVNNDNIFNIGNCKGKKIYQF